MTTSARALEIDGLANVRDLGGLRTRTGRAVRAGEVVRSDNLRSLTEMGHEHLDEIVSPRTVVDLRMVQEVAGDGYALRNASVAVLNLPMTPQAGVTRDQIDSGMAASLSEDYRRQIEVNAESIIAALETIGDPSARPIVIHCTAGKDRTGIITALLLALLEVEHEAIVADYAATAANMGPIIERVRAAQVYQDNGLASAPMWIFEADPQTMRDFLAHLADEYGGAEAYVIAKGMDPDSVERLRRDLLQD